jgi:hypothetical protein
MVKLPAALADVSALVRRASETAGVPVRHLATAAPDWHSLQLSCSNVDACRDAFARLQADKANFLAVERDERRRVHSSSSS